MADGTVNEDAGLHRAIRLRGLLFYGIGGMLGGGIYALVGKVAGLAGGRAWLCFGLAMLVAAPTALSYAALASRYPRSGGEAWFCDRAFRRPSISLMVGWLVMCSGLVSMAALSAAFAGYVQDLWPGTPRWAIEVAFLGGLAVINLRGITFSSGFNIMCTLVEVGGLVIVICAAAVALSGGGAASMAAASSTLDVTHVALLQGAALAFYAFIGFEDMVNLAEEVEDPRRNLPIAIIAGLTAVGIGYMAVAGLSTLAVEPAVLAKSAAPLVDVVSSGFPSIPRTVFTIVALFAVANSALLNFLMTTRLAYGMSQQGLLPAWFARIQRTYRTPHHAIASVLAITAALALSGTLVALAGATSLLLLAVFATVNVALVQIQRREPHEGFRVPRVVPVVGAALSLGLLGFVPADSLAPALVLVALGTVVVLLRRKRIAAPAP